MEFKHERSLEASFVFHVILITHPHSSGYCLFGSKCAQDYIPE